MKTLLVSLILINITLYGLCQGNIYRVNIEPKESELFATADYTLWIPDGLDRVQRIILHQHGCGEGAQTAGQTATDDLHWRMLAEKTNSALLGSSLWPQGECADWCDPNNGTERAYLQALEELAERSGHPEVANVNWVIWGHSGGGFWTQFMLQKHPGRFDAAVFQSAGWRYRENQKTELNSLPYVSNVPMLIHVGIGEKDHDRFHLTYVEGLQVFDMMRKKGAPVTLVIDPATGHGCGNTRYLTIPWIEAVLESNESAETTRAVEYSEHGNWFPDQVVASKWEVFDQLGNVPDFTAPRLAPVDLKATLSDEGVLLTWKATPDWESGIKTFRIYRDNVLMKAYTAPHKKEGKRTEYYRQPNFSDTPNKPLSAMEYTDGEVSQGKTYKYEVSMVNWSGLESARSQPVEILVK